MKRPGFTWPYGPDVNVRVITYPSYQHGAPANICSIHHVLFLHAFISEKFSLNC